VIRGGRVIDPASGLDEVRDVAVSGNRIARVAREIPAHEGKKVVEAAGLYVTPGLIDLHAHVCGYGGALFPDDTSLVAGTTTVVDAGGPGWRTFEDCKQRVIDSAKTRVLVFLNIVGRGMVGVEAESNVEDMDPAAAAGRPSGGRSRRGSSRARR